MFRPMLNLEEGKCYRLFFVNKWHDQYTGNIRLIGKKTIHADGTHAYESFFIHEGKRVFGYLWDHGLDRDHFYQCFVQGGYTVAHAELLEGTELEEFETKLRRR